MSASHDHAAHDHGSHGHAHHHGPASPGAGLRYAVAAALVLFGIAAATLATVRAGNATVVTRFGNPVRVITEPGLAFKLPAPVERTVEVDLRLHTTASGIHGVQTKDGLSVEVQAWVAWKVPAQDEQIRHFLRAVQNRPEEAANQLRTSLGSKLSLITGRFALNQLLNTDASLVQLATYEQALRDELTGTAKDVYGIEIVGVGIERLTLPESTIGNTISRMAAERDTVAEQYKAEGRQKAGKIRSEAERDARIAKAEASEKAAEIEAKAQTEAAKIYGEAQRTDPQLYAFIRSLDTLDQIIGGTTRLVLRTDAAPFRALVEIPGQAPTPLAQPPEAKP